LHAGVVTLTLALSLSLDMAAKFASLLFLLVVRFDPLEPLQNRPVFVDDPSARPPAAAPLHPPAKRHRRGPTAPAGGSRRSTLKPSYTPHVDCGARALVERARTVDRIFGEEWQIALPPS
jgi:hypothetical protein